MKNQLIHDALLPILFPRNDGDYLLRQKWDNLIILDACRYDTFKQLYASEGLRGRLESRTSRGTETTEFLSENFGLTRRIGNLVYVTASPWITSHFNKKFYAIVPVWKDGWSEENNTVLPQEMYRYALRANEMYPDKKLIIHFVQPHRPFIGYAKVDWWKGRAPPFRFRPVWGSVAEEGRSLLEVMDNETMMRFYKRNLKLSSSLRSQTLGHVAGSLSGFGGSWRAFGEPLHPLIPIRVYGHPGHTRIAALTKVPWLIVESSSPKLVREEGETLQSEGPTERRRGTHQSEIQLLLGTLNNQKKIKF